ncbi:MAG: transposase [Rhodospirillales bacterium]|nr:transposase [Rhodospirillales bacterium]MBN8906620.1 transposase [Rhodospirillales bacterium]MBN8925108.1 transposase [Rhodospirillales bacterium]
MPDSPIEILGARERRRRWSVDEKLRIVAESHEPGGSVRARCRPPRRVSRPASYLASPSPRGLSGGLGAIAASAGSIDPITGGAVGTASHQHLIERN